MFSPFSITGENYSILGWLLFTLSTGLITYPIFFAVTYYRVKKEDTNKSKYPKVIICMKSAMGTTLLFFFVTYIFGYFFVGLSVAIGSNVLKVTGAVPDELFDIDKHPMFFYGLISGTFFLWYIISLTFIIRRLIKTNLNSDKDKGK